MRKKERKRPNIKNLQENVSVINKKVKNLEKEIDQHEQYSRQNCLLVHGIVETDDEVTDDLVIETISTKMNIEISHADLDRMHRIGKKKAGQNKPRPIIVKLSRDNVRKRFFPIRIECKCNGKLNTKTHGNSKESKDRTRVHKCVDI